MLKQMLEHFLKRRAILFVVDLHREPTNSDAVRVLHLLEIALNALSHRQ